MSDLTSPRVAGRLSIWQLILVPAVISLVVTMLRLVGELQHWSKALFSAAPGGGGAVVGISWLVPIFGVYFALRLTRSGENATSRWRPLWTSLLGVLVMVGGGVVFASAEKSQATGMFLLAYLIMIASAVAPLLAWPALGKTLIAYGYAARIPVAIVMFFAIRGSWGTHYDALPPGFPAMGFWMKYLLLALLPQLALWIAFTVVLGTLVGGIVHAVAKRTVPVPAASV